MKVSQLYVHVFFCLKVIRSWLYLLTGVHGHLICMGDAEAYDYRLVYPHIEMTVYDKLTLLWTQEYRERYVYEYQINIPIPNT